MKRLLGVAAVVPAALVLAANAFAARNVVNVETTAHGGVVTGVELGVTVELQTRVASFRAWVDITDVTSQFARRAGIWKAQLSTAELTPGVHNLYVETTGTNGKQDFDTVRFVAGHSNETLLDAQQPLVGAPGGATAIGVDVARHDTRLRATLNGRSVGDRFDGLGALRREARLGANDGLRFGQNTLRFVAYRDDGQYDVDTLRFSIPRTRPLAGAGRDLWSSVGARVRLDGTSSLATQHRAPLGFAWRIIEKPPGSKARLHNAHGPRPFLSPDVNGVYRIQLTVSQGTAVGRDVVTADATPGDPPLGVHIDTLGDNGQVVIDGKPVANTGGAGRISLVVLSRADRSEKKSTTYAGTKAGIADLKTALTLGDQGYQNLAIVSGTGVQADAAADLAAALATIGADIGTADQSKIGSGAGFSVVGVPGSGAGSAYQNVARGAKPGNLAGFLQVNLSNPTTTQYGFVFQDFIPFTTHQNVDVTEGYANAITVGGKVYQSGAVFLFGQSGFQVLDLDGATLEPKANRTFLTTTAFAVHDAEEQRAMADFLAQIPTGDVVFVQSIPPGLPLGEGPQDPWPDIAKQIEAFGGNQAVFNSLYPVYGLAGTRRPVKPGIATGVEIYDEGNDSDASATGFLVRNRNGLFEPEAADLRGGLPNVELVKYAYQPTQQWPDSKAPGQRAANNWITRQLNLLGGCSDPTVLCDMRAQYYLNFNATWSSLLTQLQGLKYPKGEKGFSQNDFQVMKRDFVQELPLVDRVSKYINGLQEPFNRAEGRGHVDLSRIALAIQQDLGTPAGSPTLSNALTFTGYVLALGKFIPDAGPFFTAASAAFALAGYLTQPNGAGTWATIDAKVAEVGDQLSGRFDTFRGQIVQLGRILVSDPGKLQAVASRVFSDGWRLDGSYQRMLDGISKSSQVYIYTALMPVPWWLWRLETYGNRIQKANQWFCTTDRHEGAQIFMFDQVSDSGQEFHTISFPQGLPFGQVSVLAPQYVDWAQEHDVRPPAPSTAVTDPLFLPVDSPNPKALGLDKRYFYSPFVFRTHIALNYYDQCDHDPAVG